ncbi:MAG: ABC transporter ATP-binding protein [Prevotellaceae bacterium]|nr:ABC transporter ATP-binding protein [Candidatus Minthosoma equi]
MLGKIYNLLSKQERRKCIWVALSVLLRALLDFASLAALIPILILVLGDNPNMGKALLMCSAVLVFIIIKYGISLILTRFQSKFLLGLYKQFSYRMFANYYRRGLLFLKSKSSVQLGHDVNFICYAFSLNILYPIMTICGEAILLIMMVTAMIIWEPLAGILLCAGFIPMIIFNVKVIKAKSKKYGKEELEARRNQSRTVVETFRGYAELEINNAFPAMETSFSGGLDLINQCRFRMETIRIFPSLLSEASIVIGLALLLCLSNGDTKILGGVFAVAAFRLIPAVRGIMSSWTTLQANSHCVDTVADGIADENMAEDCKEQDAITFKDSIAANNISFSFPDGIQVLKNVSCRINKGERIGLKGASGSGKSTLFNALLGFYPLDEGFITIDGKKLNDSNIKSWHKLVGYVPQEIFIAQGSLAQNIALGHSEIDRDRVISVLEQVQLGEWAKTLPDGIDTHLGEAGNRMSGGQKQRIGIARALYKQAEILFFDEATSALDNQTEREINNAIESLSNSHKDITILIIAHRESSLAFCDRIIDLDEMITSKQ